MTYCRSARFFMYLLLALATTGCGRGAPDPSAPPLFDNLIVIVIDTLRADALPSYGYHRDTAPFMSELASEGIQLEGLTVSSWTRTAVATMLTGLYPQRHQVTTRADRLPQPAAYLPEILSEVGFDCRGYTANPTVGEKFGFARGYASFDSHRGDKTTKPPAAEVGRIAIDISRNLETPFFLYLHYLDPHEPYVPAAAWGSEPGQDGFIQPEHLTRNRTPLTDSNLQQMRDQYDASILELDGALRELLQGLRQMGLLERTLVVITSDHGEEFGEHGGITHGKTLFEEVLQVPLILWGDGLPSYKSEATFHLVDFTPTLLAALGVAPPTEIDGLTRWSDMLAGRLQSSTDEQLFYLDLSRQCSLALRAGDSKLIHSRGRLSNRLFDLEIDPGETDNRVHRHVERETMLTRLIELHNELSNRGLDRQVATIDSETRLHLAALGYMDEQTPPNELEFRDIPPQLTHFDSRVYGLFGNEEINLFDRRLDPSKPSIQLLRGWIEHDDSGCWISTEASCVLPAEDGDSELVVAGSLPEGASDVEVQAMVNERPARRWTLSPGRFEIKVPVKNIGTAPLIYLDLRCSTSTATPQRHLPGGFHITSITLR